MTETTDAPAREPAESTSGHSSSSVADLLATEFGSQEKSPKGPSIGNLIANEFSSSDPESDENSESTLEAEGKHTAAEEENTSEEPGDNSEEPKFRVNVNGQEMDIPQSELIAGYARQRALTQKSQKLAQERDAFEQQRTAFQQEATSAQQERQRNAEVLNTALSYLNMDPDLQKIGDQNYLLSLRQTNPALYVQEKARLDAKVANINAMLAQQQRLQAETTQQRQTQFEDLTKRESAKVFELMPEWRDQAVMQREGTQTKRDLLSRGFTEAELAQLTDSRTLAVARDAMKWREHQASLKKANAAKVNNRVTKPNRPTLTPKSEAPKAGKAQKIRQAAEKVTKNGKASDMAALIRASFE